jgi:shikimate dehydrogenase
MGLAYAEVIGDPIAHSRSPLIHRFWLDKLRRAADYRATRVQTAELADYFGRRREDPDWRGCNLTMPHKRAALALVDEVKAVDIGAVNCVVPDDGRLAGYNTDAAGIDSVVVRHDIFGREPVGLVGAGGAAAAALFELDVYCVFDYRVIVRQPARGQALLDRFAMRGSAFPFERAEEALQGCAGLINASPLGMSGFPPMPEAVLQGLSGLRRGGYVFDMVYTPPATPLLERARQLGLTAIDGLTMLIGQAEVSFRLFFGEAPPATSDRALRRLLAR